MDREVSQHPHRISFRNFGLDPSALEPVYGVLVLRDVGRGGRISPSRSIVFAYAPLEFSALGKLNHPGYGFYPAFFVAHCFFACHVYRSKRRSRKRFSTLTTTRCISRYSPITVSLSRTRSPLSW